MTDDMADRLGYAYGYLENEIDAADRNRDGMTAAHPDVPIWQALAALVEEVGEVARALHDDEGDARVRAELIQVATVAILWAARPDCTR